MRLLLDACAASRSMLSMLVEGGHDVMSVLDVDRRATDEEVMALAMREGRVLITEDKDFGELVFVRRLPHPCIVRLRDMSMAEKVQAVQGLIANSPDAMRERTIIVVTRNRVRIRSGVNPMAPGG